MFDLVLCILGMVFELQSAAGTSYAFPPHKHCTVRAVFLTLRIP